MATRQPVDVPTVDPDLLERVRATLLSDDPVVMPDRLRAQLQEAGYVPETAVGPMVLRLRALERMLKHPALTHWQDAVDGRPDATRPRLKVMDIAALSPIHLEDGQPTFDAPNFVLSLRPGRNRSYILHHHRTPQR